MNSLLSLSRLNVVSSLLPTLILSGVRRQAPALWRRAHFPSRGGEGSFWTLHVLPGLSVGKLTKAISFLSHFLGILLQTNASSHFSEICLMPTAGIILLNCSQQKLSLPPPFLPPLLCSFPLLPYPHHSPVLSAAFSSLRGLTEGLQLPAPRLDFPLNELITCISIKPHQVPIPSSWRSSNCHSGFSLCTEKIGIQGPIWPWINSVTLGKSNESIK